MQNNEKKKVFFFLKKRGENDEDTTKKLDYCGGFFATGAKTIAICRLLWRFL